MCQISSPTLSYHGWSLCIWGTTVWFEAWLSQRLLDFDSSCCSKGFHSFSNPSKCHKCLRRPSQPCFLEQGGFRCCFHTCCRSMTSHVQFFVCVFELVYFLRFACELSTYEIGLFPILSSQVREIDGFDSWNICSSLCLWRVARWLGFAACCFHLQFYLFEAVFFCHLNEMRVTLYH